MADGEVAGESTGDVTVTIAGSGEQAVVIVKLGRREHKAKRLRAEAISENVIYGTTPYRGALEFFAGKGGGVVVLNVVPLDGYLLSVVPAEMPASWPQEALRAQAVAARTYAVARMLDQRAATYDVYAGQSSQEYRGVKGEHPSSTQAVHDTAGQILLYEGQPITAYYCSDAGGYTKTGELPYLQAVPSFCPRSPHNDWSVALSTAQLAELARGEGHEIGKVLKVSAVNDPTSGHLISITIQGNKSECTIKATRLRSLLGLDKMKSTLAVVDGATADNTKSQAAVTITDPTTANERLNVNWPTVSLEGFSRPWVLWATGGATIKMRLMYAYDGINLLRCNREVYVVSGMPTVQVPALSPATTTAAPADGGIVIRGSGFGHGLGMSQWGARQLAEDGYSYRDILLYFYRGVELVASSSAAETTSQDKGEFFKPFER